MTAPVIPGEFADLAADPLAPFAIHGADDLPQSMELSTRPGAPVRFSARGGADRELAEARAVLTVDATYTVQAVHIGSFRSFVELSEFPGRQFNTVMFETIS